MFIPPPCTLPPLLLRGRGTSFLHSRHPEPRPFPAYAAESTHSYKTVFTSILLRTGLLSPLCLQNGSEDFLLSLTFCHSQQAIYATY